MMKCNDNKCDVIRAKTNSIIENNLFRVAKKHFGQNLSDVVDKYAFNTNVRGNIVLQLPIILLHNINVRYGYWY